MYVFTVSWEGNDGSFLSLSNTFSVQMFLDFVVGPLSSWDRRPTGFPCDGSAGARENRDTQSMFTLGYGSVWHLRVTLNKHTGRSLSLALRTIPLAYLNPGKAEALNTCSDDPHSFRPQAWPNVAETY